MPDSATNYLNTKGRRIFKSKTGAFYAMSNAGTKIYKPKASFRKAGGEGAKVKISANRNNTSMIPSKIRPAAKKAAPRKVRSNKGVTRAGTVVRRRVAGGPRKVRSNAGVARGPREGTVQRRMNAAAKRLAARRARARKVRSNKGVARGPRNGTVQRRMNAAAAKRRAVGPRKPRANKGVARTTATRKMAKLITPTEAELYNMIFGSPAKRRVAKKAPAKKAPAKKAPAKRRVAKKASSARRPRRSPINMLLRSRSAKK